MLLGKRLGCKSLPQHLLTKLIRMDSEVKTVAVWFQNKRQTEKKAGRLSSTSSLSSSSEQSGLKRVSSPSRNTTLGKRTRPPHYTDKYPPAASRRKPRLSADDPQSTSATSYQADCDTYSPHVRHTEPQIYRPMEVSDHTIIPAQELWKYLLSSPPGESLQASSSDVDSREPSENIPAVDNQGSTIDGGSRRSRMLEWVCDRQTKKRRNNRGGSGDPATLMATEGTDETCRNCFHRPDFDTAISLLTLPGDAGPSEDVIRGASLLLCFKNSAPKMRKVDQV